MSGMRSLGAQIYPDERVAQFINSNFVPIKIRIKENKEAFGRFGAQWTPTLIVLDPEGEERYRFEGFLPPEDFLAQMGRAKGEGRKGRVFPEPAIIASVLFSVVQKRATWLDCYR